jgi:hypothetical protein
MAQQWLSFVTQFEHFVSRPNDPQQFRRWVFDGDGVVKRNPFTLPVKLDRRVPDSPRRPKQTACSSSRCWKACIKVEQKITNGQST